MEKRARRECLVSEPYIRVICRADDRFLKEIIRAAPPELLSVLSELSRHTINGTFSLNRHPSASLKTFLYAIADPDTSEQQKRKILQRDSDDCRQFVRAICHLLLLEGEQQLQQSSSSNDIGQEALFSPRGHDSIASRPSKNRRVSFIANASSAGASEKASVTH